MWPAGKTSSDKKSTFPRVTYDRYTVDTIYCIEIHYSPLCKVMQIIMFELYDIHLPWYSIFFWRLSDGLYIKQSCFYPTHSLLIGTSWTLPVIRMHQCIFPMYPFINWYTTCNLIGLWGNISTIWFAINLETITLFSVYLVIKIENICVVENNKSNYFNIDVVSRSGQRSQNSITIHLQSTENLASARLSAAKIRKLEMMCELRVITKCCLVLYIVNYISLCERYMQCCWNLKQQSLWAAKNAWIYGAVWAMGGDIPEAEGQCYWIFSLVPSTNQSVANVWHNTQKPNDCAQSAIYCASQIPPNL